MRSRNKLLLLTLIPLIAITAMVTAVNYWSGMRSLDEELSRYRAELLETRKAELKAYLMMGVTAIKPLYDADQQGENQARAKTILKAMRFGDDGYFFAYDSQGMNTLHAIKPQLEGKNLYGLKDENGVAVIAGLISASKQGDGFLNFSWHKPTIDAQAPKLGYAEYLPKWDWVLGTGIYIDDGKPRSIDTSSGNCVSCCVIRLTIRSQVRAKTPEINQRTYGCIKRTLTVLRQFQGFTDDKTSI